MKVGPSPRFGSQLAIDKGNLYLFGGMVEDANDRQLTHKDFYSIGNYIITFYLFLKNHFHVKPNYIYCYYIRYS